MSDFSVIVEIVSKTIQCIFDAVIDAFFIFLLISATLPPWRWFEHSLYWSFIDPHNFRNISFVSFCGFVVDIFLLPMLLISCLSPIQWKTLGIIWNDHKITGLVYNTYDNINDIVWETKGRIFDVFCATMLDVLSLCTVPCYLFSHWWRAFAVIRMYKRLQTLTNYESVLEANHEFGIYFRKLGVSGIIDTLVFFFTIPCVFVPTTWKAYYYGSRIIRSKYEINQIDIENIYNDITENIFVPWRKLLLNIARSAIIDIAVFPFLLMALLSPLRRSKLLRVLNPEPASPTSLNSNWRESDTYKNRPGCRGFQYDISLRKEVFHLGFLAVCDTFDIIIIGLLRITGYRYGCVESVITLESRSLNDHGVIYKQGALLLFDFFILGFIAPILFISRIRWNPLSEVLVHEYFLNNNFYIYKVALRQFMQLILDALVSPFVLIILVTNYRADIIKSIWYEKVYKNQFGFFHYAVVCNQMIIFHDVFILAPFIALTHLGIVRANTIWRVLRPLLYPISTNQTNTEIDLENDTSIGLSPSSIGDHIIINQDILPNVVPESIVVPLSWQELKNLAWKMDDSRKLLWIQVELFCGDILNLPFIILLLITYWRWAEVTRLVELVDPNNKLFEKLSLKNNTFAIWKVIQGQTLYLMRDIVFLIPFSICFITFYRFPAIIADILSITSSKPISGAPKFKILSCHATFPAKGAPLLNFILQRNSDSQLTGGKLDANSPVSFHVIGSELWKHASHTYGATLIAVAKSLLPLKLIDKENIGLTELINGLASTAQFDANFQNVSLWLKLDFGVAKSTSLLWKLKRLPPDVSITLQFEATEISGHEKQIKKSGCILCRVTLTISQLLALLKDSEGNLPDESLNMPTTLLSSDVHSPDDNLANSFYIIVGKAFLELSLDFIFLLMFFLTIANPYRFMSAVYSILEHEDMYKIRAADYCCKLQRQADSHLLSFRKESETQANDIIKSNFQSSSPQINLEYNSTSLRQAFHLKCYRKLSNKINGILGTIKGCDSLKANIQSRWEYHDDLLKYWYLQCGLYRQLKFNTKSAIASLLNHNNNIYQISNLFNEERRKVAIKLAKNTSAIESSLSQIRESVSVEISAKNAVIISKKKSKFWGSVGLFSRQIATTRSLIGFAFTETLKDFGFLLMFILITITGVRSISIIRDFVESGNFNITSESTRSIIKKHAVELRMDLYHIMIITTNTFIIVATVISLPTFIAEMITHLESLESFADFTIEHRKEFFSYLCEFLLLIFEWKTYKLIFKSVLFSFLVPGACLAEACLVVNWNAETRLTLGMAIWVVLFTFSVVITNTESSSFITQSLLILMCSLFVVLVGATSAVSLREHYMNPRFSSVRTPKLTWSHILAVITGPLESIQLSSIVLYYFWLSPKSSSLSPLERYGKDNLSRVLVWNADGLNGLSTSTAVACISIFIWAALVSLPLTYSSENGKKRDMIKNIRRSSAYEFCTVLISRIFTVWIIATLLRPSSCVASFDDDSNTYLVSTSLSVECSDRSYWAAFPSLPLLVYFLITSSILHSDDAVLLNDSSSNDSVTFAPVYASWIRSGHLAIIVTAMGTCWNSPTGRLTSVPLIFVLVISILMTISPVFFPKGDVCSFLAVTYIRSAGFLSVAWTAFICLIRWNRDSVNNTEPFLHTETTIYIGWIVIHIISVIIGTFNEIKAYNDWENYLKSISFFYYVEDMFSRMQDSFLQDFQYSDMLGVRGINRNAISMSYKKKLELFKKEVLQARSLNRTARALLNLEKSIVFGRLKYEFLISRKDWVISVQRIASASTQTIRDKNNQIDIGTNFSVLYMLMTSLRDSVFNDESTLLSRNVLLILLSRKFPIEICIEVLSYLDDTFRLRQIVNNFSSVSYNAPQPKLLESKKGSRTKNFSRDYFYYSDEYFKQANAILLQTADLYNNRKDDERNEFLEYTNTSILTPYVG